MRTVGTRAALEALRAELAAATGGAARPTMRVVALAENGGLVAALNRGLTRRASAAELQQKGILKAPVGGAASAPAALPAGARRGRRRRARAPS